MRLAASILALLVTATMLSGCSGSSPSPTSNLAAGKGGMSGLLIDDVYRPIPGGLVLIEGIGLTATTDDLGQFHFDDLLPGSYVLLATAPGHEAAPVPVDVQADKYAEVEVLARRVFSDNGRTVTSEYSVFVPCAIDFVYSGIVTDCTGDQSGDTFRAGYTVDYRPYNKTATYLLVEMKATQEDRYEVQLRVDDGSDAGGPRYAVADFKGDYLRMQFKVGVKNDVYDGQKNNVPFNVTKKIGLILFSDSQGREELQGAGVPVCCGAGAHFGIRAKFIQTLFLGEPDPSIDVNHYCVLATSC
ncbi:MAG: carboxypeptidase-like regulatory domain-containing protein [Thermoplasmatota archaeon]